MFKLSLNIKCELCGNDKKFYLMPLDQKVKSGDYIHSKTKYRITCKKCGQDYILTLNLGKLERKK